uniref:Oxidation resistance 1 n=1 Tax=Gorilla gorilla gorilla TaxID=9595 RepID=A0A2I2ZTA9_GORGO
MDYLTTFTEKSGRLLRGTANRLWAFGGGGEARQVRFEDYLREPAQGDLGCGSPPHRPPAPSSPEGPGEPTFLSPGGESRPGSRETLLCLYVWSTQLYLTPSFKVALRK